MTPPDGTSNGGAELEREALRRRVTRGAWTCPRHGINAAPANPECAECAAGDAS